MRSMWTADSKELPTYTGGKLARRSVVTYMHKQYVPVGMVKTMLFLCTDYGRQVFYERSVAVTPWGISAITLNLTLTNS